MTKCKCGHHKGDHLWDLAVKHKFDGKGILLICSLCKCKKYRIDKNSEKAKK